MKRAIDILFALLVFVPFLPFGIIIALLLRRSGEGKIFYFQPRVGYGGKLFRMVKFATMLENSPNMGTGDITLRDDPRVLFFGKYLRKTKLNEIPQILNLLKGDMTLVGPRPLTPGNFDLYPEHVKKEIVKVRPGLTGVGSILFRDEESIISQSQKGCVDCYREDIAPFKGALELWYIANQSFALDMKIVLLTAWVIAFKKSSLPFRLLKGIPQESSVLV